MRIKQGQHSQCGRERIFADDLCETKIGEFDSQIFVEEEDVLRFDVPMHNIAFVLATTVSMSVRQALILMQMKDSLDISSPGVVE